MARDQRIPAPQHPQGQITERVLGVERQLQAIGSNKRVIVPIAGLVGVTPAPGMFRGSSGGGLYWFDGVDWRKVMNPGGLP